MSGWSRTTRTSPAVTEPIRIVELKAHVTGYLENIYFKDGQDIQEGKPLFSIDRRIYKAEFDRAGTARPRRSGTSRRQRRTSSARRTFARPVVDRRNRTTRRMAI